MSDEGLPVQRLEPKGTNQQLGASLAFVLRQYYELTDLPHTAEDEAVYKWIRGRLAEVDRLERENITLQRMHRVRDIEIAERDARIAYLESDHS
jgi:hypothetical protein